MLETSQYPSGLCPEEVAFFVGVDGKHPVTQFFGLNFLIQKRSKNLIVNPGFPLEVFRSSKLLVVCTHIRCRSHIFLTHSLASRADIAYTHGSGCL